MAKLTEWRQAILMPVLAKALNKAWELNALEKILTKSIAQCVDACLKNYGQICTTLSGGLDSSLCLAKIREIVGYETPIYTFTIAGSKKYPDLEYARIVANKFGTIHHEHIPAPNDIEEAKRSLGAMWPDEPYRPGNAAVFLIYKYISQRGFKCVIAHDGIDELLGGYWEHRQRQSPEEKIRAFEKFWGLLEKDHLLLLERKANYFGVEVLLPYLQQEIVEYVSRIPLDDRTSFKESKIPLRTIGRKYLPQEIIARRKRGFCGALDKE